MPVNRLLGREIDGEVDWDEVLYGGGSGYGGGGELRDVP